MVSHLAQRVKGSGRTYGPASSASRQEERQSCAVVGTLNRTDAYQLAVIGATINQTLKIQRLSASERMSTIELMQQAGVISR